MVKPIVCSLLAATLQFSLFGQNDNEYQGSTRSIVTRQEYKVASATGPLKIHPQNSRYFANANGTPVFLIGSHTWSNFQDYGMEGDMPFDYDAYLAFMVSHRFNFMRLWTWEHAAWSTWTPEKTVTEPMPYLRTGPGLALDGKARFDLDQFNQRYFDRLRARIVKAREKGIYTSIMLFQAFSGVWPKSIDLFGHNAFAGHYYNKDNNIQRFNGDKNDDKILDIDDQKVRAYQAAYIRKIIDTVWDLDNVLYEVINEGGNPQWDSFVIKTVTDYEISKGRKHPLGLTGHGNQTLLQMMESECDWVSPGISDDPSMKNAQTDPPLWKGDKVSVLDTDHIWGHGIDYRWVWKSFLRGHNIIFMDPWDPLPLWFDQEANRPDHPNYILGRKAMKNVAELVSTIDISSLLPTDDFIQNGFCLSNPAKEYLLLVSGTSIEIDLTGIEGRFTVKWIHLLESVSQVHKTVEGGRKMVLRSPFTSEAILHLKIIPPNGSTK